MSHAPWGFPDSTGTLGRAARLITQAAGATRRQPCDFTDKQERKSTTMAANNDVRLWNQAAYEAALGSWAAKTLSYPEFRWAGPGVYRYDGYMDGNRPVATLERIG